MKIINLKSAALLASVSSAMLLATPALADSTYSIDLKDNAKVYFNKDGIDDGSNAFRFSFKVGKLNDYKITLADDMEELEFSEEAIKILNETKTPSGKNMFTANNKEIKLNVENFSPEDGTINVNIHKNGLIATEQVDKNNIQGTFQVTKNGKTTDYKLSGYPFTVSVNAVYLDIDKHAEDIQKLESGETRARVFFESEQKDALAPEFEQVEKTDNEFFNPIKRAYTEEEFKALTQKNIDGYSLKSYYIDGIGMSNMGGGFFEHYIVYFYTKDTNQKVGKVNLSFELEDGTKVGSASATGTVGTKYNFEDKVPEGYKVISLETALWGEFSEEDINAKVILEKVATETSIENEEIKEDTTSAEEEITNENPSISEDEKPTTGEDTTSTEETSKEPEEAEIPTTEEPTIEEETTTEDTTSNEEVSTEEASTSENEEISIEEEEIKEDTTSNEEEITNEESTSTEEEVKNNTEKETTSSEDNSSTINANENTTEEKVKQEPIEEVKPTINNPIKTESGEEIIGLSENGDNVYVKTADGKVKKVSTESVNGIKNNDGTVTVRTSDGKLVKLSKNANLTTTPRTSTNVNTASLSAFIASVFSIGLFATLKKKKA